MISWDGLLTSLSGGGESRRFCRGFTVFMLNSMNYIHNTVYLVFFARIVLYLEPNPSLVGFCCRTFRLEGICNFPPSQMWRLKFRPTIKSWRDAYACVKSRCSVPTSAWWFWDGGSSWTVTVQKSNKKWCLGGKNLKTLHCCIHYIYWPIPVHCLQVCVDFGTCATIVWKFCPIYPFVGGGG